MTHLRPIDISDRPAFVPAPQPAPMLDWIPIARLVIDDRYQRPLGTRNWVVITKIAAAFDWASFGPVLLAPVEGGRFAVIDGQHRVHAAALCGIESVPAMIITAALDAQARAFVQVNSRRVGVSPHIVFRAALAAGEGWATRCDAVVAAGGGRLMAYNSSAANRKSGQVYCVGLVRDLVAAGHAAPLTAALRALVAYDELAARPALFSDYILRPLVQAIAADPGFQDLDLAAFLRRNDPFKVIDAAIRASATLGATKPQNILGRDVLIQRLRVFAIGAGAAHA